MPYSRTKIVSLSLFISIVLFTLLAAASFWNLLDDNHVQPGFWSVFLIILVVLAASIFFIFHLKISDEKILAQKIEARVEEERTKLLLEFSKQQEEDSVKESTIINFDEILENILPKGNFKTLENYTKKLLANLASELEIILAAFYVIDVNNENFQFICGYALPEDHAVSTFKAGENINGQVALSQEISVIKDIPEDYFEAISGLGSSKPRNLAIVPFLTGEKTVAVLEIATFKDISDTALEIIKRIAETAAEKLNQLHKS